MNNYKICDDGMLCGECNGTGLFFKGNYAFGQIQEPEPCEKCKGTGKIQKCKSLFNNNENLLGGW